MDERVFSVSRRTAVSTFLLAGSRLLLPSIANADSIDFDRLPATSSEPITFRAQPMLTDQEFDNLLKKHAEREAKEVIQDAMADTRAITAAGGRPRYETVYGKVQTKRTGWRNLPGIPPGGVKINGGGQVYVTQSGGGSITFSVSLPGGVGSIGVSVPLASRKWSAAGYSIRLPGNGYYKVRVNMTYKVRPYVVYKVTNKSRTVYAKQATSEFYDLALDKVKVRLSRCRSHELAHE